MYTMVLMYTLSVVERKVAPAAKSVERSRQETGETSNASSFARDEQVTEPNLSHSGPRDATIRQYTGGFVSVPSQPSRQSRTMASTNVAGPSRQATQLSTATAPSTSGDSESTAPKESEKGLDVGVLKEVARTALVESLNDVGEAVYVADRRSKAQRRSSSIRRWRDHWGWSRRLPCSRWVTCGAVLMPASSRGQDVLA